ncbi:hypothetical protein [Streptomyces sp. E-08]|uniref:hypothetical protein n=1 Tax=Streptomyces sp. E-08 TaxID=3404047 RepID=UPI003CEAE2E9
MRLSGRNGGAVPVDEAHTVVEDWVAHPNIVMLDTAVKEVRGRKTGQLAIVVGVIEKKAAAALTAVDFPIPPTVEVDVIQPDGSVGHMTMPTDVIETGRIRPLGLWWAEQGSPGGFQIQAASTVHASLNTCGTLGVTTFYRKKRCFLTCCHVIGDLTSGPGLDVYQPHKIPDRDNFRIGVCDGTLSIDPVNFDPLNNAPSLPRNTYDFAWGVADDDRKQTSFTIWGGIHREESPLEIRSPPKVGETVTWIGMMTGEAQTSTIQSVRAQGEMTLDGDRLTYWRDLIALAPVDGLRAERGDSGAALIATKDKRVVGLLCMGSDEQPRYWASRIPPENHQASWWPWGRKQVMRLRTP